MKKLFAISALLLSNAVFAQSPWNLNQVSNGDTTVGYIYQTYSSGTQFNTPPEKYPTALRFICSTTGYSSPIFGIYWHKATGNNLLQVKISVDRQPFPQDWTWLQDGALVYRSLDQSNELIEKMKTGRLLTVGWTDAELVRHLTIFNLLGFNTHLKEFTSACNK